MFFLYILQSTSSGRYYVGQSENVQERLSYHNAGYSKALKNRGPWQLIYTEPYATRAAAVRRERQIKSWKDRSLIASLVGASR